MIDNANIVTMKSPPEAKIRLMRGMFAGRNDVLARRYGREGGMGVKEVKALDAAHAAIPDNEVHVLLATGSYRGEVITQITKHLKQS